MRRINSLTTRRLCSEKSTGHLKRLPVFFHSLRNSAILAGIFSIGETTPSPSFIISLTPLKGVDSIGIPKAFASLITVGYPSEMDVMTSNLNP